MTLVKHPEFGNKHVKPEEVDALVAAGWVKWPRTKEQKAGAVSLSDQIERQFIARASEPVAALEVEKRGPGRPRKATE